MSKLKIIAITLMISSCATHSNKKEQRKWFKCVGRISVEQCGENYLKGSAATLICVNQLSREYFDSPSDDWLLENGCPDTIVNSDKSE
jgi:hypothetical protein